MIDALLNRQHAVLPLILALFLSACATVDDRTASWPSTSSTNLIGKCSDISGRYRNIGSSAPDSAKPILLSELLQVEAGDEVTITQTPDTIIATSFRDGVAVSAATYISSLVKVLGGMEGWDPAKPMAFGCLLDVVSGRRDVHFNHQHTPTEYLAAGALVAAKGAAVRYSKADDGSLLVVFAKSSGVLLVLVPIGVTENVWYRYPTSTKR